MTNLQEYQYKLRLIKIIQDQLHCDTGFWSKTMLARKPLADLKKVVASFKPVLQTVHIDSVLILLEAGNGKKRLCRIQDSPHYHFLLGDSDEYINYHRDYLSKKLNENQNIYAEFNTINSSNFNRFMYNFEYLDKLHKDNFILLVPYKKGYYIARDGDHRLATLKYKKITQFQALIKRV